MRVATYAIGDIQGCFKTLERLLRAIAFSPSEDRLWLVGDLVNRGPDSAGVLRWARGLGERVVAVLGNHELNLLASAEGVRPARKRDTFDDVLGASDREELLAWLCERPLVHREGEFLLVHAGLHPTWTVDHAVELAAEAEKALAGESGRDVLAALAGAEGVAWSDDLEGVLRAAVIVRVLTRVRTCRSDGAPCEGFSGPPSEAPPGCLPWFEWTDRCSRDVTVVFGHWSALGSHVGDGVIGLDSGIARGGPLTAVRLDDGTTFQASRVEPLPD